MFARIVLMASFTAVFCGPVLAAEKPPRKLDFSKPINPPPVYRDLPGVAPPAPFGAGDDDGFTCTTVLRTYRNDSRRGFSRTLPVRVYRCERNGIVIEQPNPPARGQWMPGINPPDYRRR